MGEDQDKQSGGWGALAAFSSQRDGHGDSNRSFWSFTLFFTLLALVGIGYYTYYQASGATFFGKTVSSNVDLETGLLAHWTFDGDQMDWASSTGEVMNRGTTGVRGNVTNFTSTAVSPGKLGQALTFDGTNDYVEATNAGYFDFERTDPFSFSVWYKNTDPTIGTARSFAGNMTNTNNTGWSFGTWGAGACSTNEYLGFLLINNYPTNSLVVCTSSKIPVSGWHHAVVTYDGSSSASGVKIYIDGVSQALSTFRDSLSATTLSTLKLRIGDDQTNDYWKGGLDDVRIYNRALTAVEVEKLYGLGEGSKVHVTATSTLSTSLQSGLMGYWSFNGPDMSTTSILYDRSGNNRHAQLYGTGTPSQVPGKLGQAIDFKGQTNAYVTSAGFIGPSVESGLSQAMWMKPTALNTSQNITEVGASNNFEIYFSGDNVYCRYRDSNTYWGTPAINISSYRNKFFHIACILDYSQLELRVYIDGSEAVTKDLTGATNTFDNCGSNCGFTIGGRPYAPYYSSFLVLDEIYLYNRVLSVAEVQELYQLGVGAEVNTVLESSPTDPLENGLVGYWSFNGPDMNGTTTAYDRSPYANHGTTASTPPAVPGKLGQALSFDGVCDRVSLSAGAEWAYDTFSISTWVYNKGRVNSYNMPVGLSSKYYLDFSPTAIDFKVHNGSGWITAGKTMANTNKWQHVVGVFDGVDVAVYVDGVFADSTTYTGAPYVTTTNAPYIGNYDTSCSTYNMNGYLDEVRIYDRALSADEIARLYARYGGL